MNKNMDMTEGNAVKHILLFALPMLIGNIFQQVYNLADSMIVGQMIGSAALGAIGDTGPISFFFFAICNGIGSGGGIITSQFFGAHDDNRVRSCIANVGYIMLVFPLIVGIAAFFLARPLLTLLETPTEYMRDAVMYTQIMCIGLLFVSVYNYVSSMLRALGDSKTPLYFLIFSCVVNIILDIAFVKLLLPFNLGVAGAGIATIISQLLSGIACLVFAFKTNTFFKLTKEHLRFQKDIVWQAVRLGIPLSLQFSMIAISTMALQRVVNQFGPVAIPAFTATSRIEQLIHQPYQTLGASLSTFCGQNYGAKKNKRVTYGYRKAMLIMFLFTLLMIPIMQLFGKQITSIFVKDSIEVVEMGATALKISSLFYVFLGIIYVVRGILSGIGDATFAFINGIVEVVGRFTVPLLLIAFTPLDVWSIWVSVGIVWLLSGATAWLRYLKYYFHVKKRPAEEQTV